MTVVAGCLLPDGALLGADCRVTWKRSDGSEIQSDNAAKILRLGPASALGYSGDIKTVSWLFGHLFKQLPKRRVDPINIKGWLPRFLRDTYHRLDNLYKVDPVSFLVAGSIKGRPTQIPKSLVWASLKRSSELELNNWLVLKILNDINTPGDHFKIPNTSMGILYKMQSPEFVPSDYPPLHYTAIGTGRDVQETLDAYSILFAVDHTNRAVVWFIDAMTGFLYDTDDRKVGGIVLAAQLQNGNVKFIGFDDNPKKRKTRVGIGNKDGRFIVYTADGRKIILKYPGELMRGNLPKHLIINDLKTTIPSETQRRASLLNILNKDTRIKKK